MKPNLRGTAGQYAILVLVLAALAAQLFINRTGAAVDAAQAAQAAPRAAEADGMNWAQVSERDLDVASVFLLTRDRGVRAALDSLQRMTARDESLRGSGHQLAHALGRYAMARRNDLAVLGECAPLFQSGCFHGALEGYFLQGGTIDRASAGRICASRAAAGARGFELLECWHGLGHGLMVHYGGDFKQALPICDALQTGQAQRECLDGVFMERAIRAVGSQSINVGDGPGMGQAHHGGAEQGGGHGEHGAGGAAAAGGHAGHAASGAPAAGTHGEHAAGGASAAGGHAGHAAAPVEALSREQRANLCGGLDARHQPSCWAYQPLVLFSIHGVNPTAVLRACDAAPAVAVRDCYQGFGKQVLGALSGSAPQMISACRAGNTAYATDCLLGGVEYFTDLEWTIEPGVAFCRQVPGEAKPRCYEMIGARLALAHPTPEPIRTVCGQVESAFVGACLAGAGLRES